MEVLHIIYFIVFGISTFFLVYYAFLGLVGLFHHKQNYAMCDDKLKFCIFVPCHNEEDVIAATVDNLAKMVYDPTLYDIYFIADNCKDKTAERVREAIRVRNLPNFFVLERNVDDPNKKGKPHAMDWGITTLEAEDKFYGKYDMFMVLDADNFVDADILKHINSQYWSYCEGKRPAMIQTYVDSKNKNSLIARGYYAGYRYTNGFNQLSRHNLGLVPALCGTGFAVDTSFLKEIGGFRCKSLTEDIEFQTIATLKGKIVAYNHNARIYDEKPTGLVQSAVQKTRWSQGYWYIFFKYGWRLLLRAFHPKELKFFFKRLDNLMYIATMFFMTLSFAFSIYSFALWCFGAMPVVPLWVSVASTLVSSVSVVLMPVSFLFDGTKREKKRFWVELIPNVFAMAIHGMVYTYSAVIGLFKCGNQKVWKKTKHQVTVIMEDLQTETTANEEEQSA